MDEKGFVCVAENPAAAIDPLVYLIVISHGLMPLVGPILDVINTSPYSPQSTRVRHHLKPRFPSLASIRTLTVNDDQRFDRPYQVSRQSRFPGALRANQNS